MIKTFGCLTQSVPDVNKILNEVCLEYLFQNSSERLKKMTVVESERQIAFENLKKLITELQTKRLRYKAKSVCKYFTL